jgi:DNA repair protein RAD16
VIDNTPVVSDAEDASGLEYDEGKLMQIDESDDDGSEFEVDSDTEDEETMRPAGRRLAIMNEEVEFGFQTPLNSLSDQSASSEEEPLASSSKSKGKAGPRATKKVTPLSEGSKKKIMTISELRAKQKEARKALLSARRANKEAEMALITKLGRRLTHVSLLPQLIFIFNF